MVLLLIDDVLDDALLVGLAVGERAVTALPRLEHGEHVAVGPHEIARGNLQVVDEILQGIGQIRYLQQEEKKNIDSDSFS